MRTEWKGQTLGWAVAGGRRGRCWLNRLHSGFTLTSWIKAILQTAAVTHCACVCGYMEVNEGPTKRDLGEGNLFFFFFSLLYINLGKGRMCMRDSVSLCAGEK